MLLLSPFTRTSLSPILTISQAENSGRSLWLALAGPKSCGITVTKRREFERAGLSFKRVFEAVSFSGRLLNAFAFALIPSQAASNLMSLARPEQPQRVP